MQLYYESDHLQHHGVKGMRWGVRRYQNKDGSLTALGEKRASRLNSKKDAEDLKDRRVARRLSIQKQRQQLREDSRDRATQREVARRHTRIDERDAQTRSRAAKQTSNDNDTYYELPDTPERQRASMTRGQKIALTALAVAGTVAAGVAIRRYMGNRDARRVQENLDDAASEAARNVAAENARAASRAERRQLAAKIRADRAARKADTAAYRRSLRGQIAQVRADKARQYREDQAHGIFTEAQKYRNQSVVPSSASTASTASKAASNVAGLLAPASISAPKSNSAPAAISSALSKVGGIVLDSSQYRELN